MNRREARERTFLAMYQHSFGEELEEIVRISRTEAPDYAVDEFGEGVLKLYSANCEAVNQAIESKLKGWEAGRLARVNLALLRVAVTEMLYAQPDMHSVAINEAVELAKKYGDEEDYQFINGVLGAVSRQNPSSGPAKQEQA